MTKWVLPKTWFIALIRFYQKHVSARTSPACRFSPTCSAYAIEAIDRFGVFLGTGLALWRILRCNPLCHGGYDPVPERFPFPWRRKK